MYRGLCLVLLAALSGMALGLGSQRHLRAVASATPKAGKLPYRQTLHNFQNVQYYADFRIGGQDIAGIFDTGSFELLVRSSRCAKCAHPTAPYDRKQSATYGKNGTVTKHVFGSGPCVSMMGYDSVAVGDLVSQHQAFWEIIDHRIPVLDTAKFAAIVGIGPNFAYGNSEQTLLMSYGVQEFSICLNRPSGSVGYLTWGTDAGGAGTRDAQGVSTARVTGKHHWVTPLRNVTFQRPGGDLSAIPCGASGCAAIIDSGTSLIAAPGIALMQLSDQIPQIEEDCSNVHELPTLRFVVDGNDLELPPQAYVMRITGATLEAENIWDILFFKPKLRKTDICMPAFMQLDMMSQNGPIWILGMPFFRYYHTTFDRKNKEMRFAKAGPDCEPVTHSGANGTKELGLLDRAQDFQPMQVAVDALVPPTLSGMMDFPFGSLGELDL